MTTLSFNVNRLEHYTRAIKEKAQRLSDDLETITQKTAYDCQRDMIRFSPSPRTGTLNRSYRTRELGKWSWIVDQDPNAINPDSGTPAEEYGPHVNWGTSRMKGRFMKERTENNRLPKMKEAVRQAMARAAR